MTLTCAMLTCGDPDGDKKLSYTIDCPNGIYHIGGYMYARLSARTR